MDEEDREISDEELQTLLAFYVKRCIFLQERVRSLKDELYFLRWSMEEKD